MTHGYAHDHGLMTHCHGHGYVFHLIHLVLIHADRWLSHVHGSPVGKGVGCSAMIFLHCYSDHMGRLWIEPWVSWKIFSLATN